MSLYEQLAAKPKISLHDHLDGGLRPATMVELAKAADHTLPATDPAELENWFGEHANSGSLPKYLQCFDHTTAVMQTAEALHRVAYEAVLDLAADNVIYAELRWAPEQHLRAGLSLQEAVTAVKRGMEEAMEETSHSIHATQLLTAMRHADRGLEIAKLTVENLGSSVVGFDIAGAEDGFPPSRFSSAFDYLAKNLVPTTVHAGEAAGVDSIHDAIYAGRAVRLGHGVRVAEDISLEADTILMGPVAQWVRDRSIALELCPSSNLQTGAIENFGPEPTDHPLPLLYELNFNTTINTDNRLLSVTTLTQELVNATEWFGFSADDLLAMQINAAEAAFTDFDTRADLVDQLILGWQE